MSQIKARAFMSPTLVFLAMDWDDGRNVKDFLGFAIRRTPGFGISKVPGQQPPAGFAIALALMVPIRKLMSRAISIRFSIFNGGTQGSIRKIVGKNLITRFSR